MERARISHASGRPLLVCLMALAAATFLVLSCDKDPVGYTYTDDFSSNTTASYRTHCLCFGGSSATATIIHDPGTQKVHLRSEGGYADVVMEPSDAPVIQPGTDFSFSYDVSVLSEFIGMIYLGDLQGHNSGTWLRFGLDTYRDVVTACVIVNGTGRDVYSSSISATGGTIKATRTGSTYSFYLNGGQVWSGAIPELDGITLTVGAMAAISSGGSGLTAEISVDNWNQVQQ